MPFETINIAPGVYANGTRLAAQGRWRDASLVRFHKGFMEPVGGWINADETVTGLARDTHAWRDNSYQRWLGIGTNTHLYVWDGSVLTDITPADYVAGRADGAFGRGYGTGPYGAAAYGTPRVNASLLLVASTWQLANWGEELIAYATSDGRIFQWAPGQGLALPITNAPIDNLGMFVTDERHLVALGAGGDPRNVQWSDREDYTLWTPSPTTLAGSLPLESDSGAVAGVGWRGATVILTETDAHIMSWLGSPYVYGIDKLAAGTSLAGSGAVIAVPSGVVWMGNDSFWIYNGVVQKIPCDVEDYIFDNINKAQLTKVVAIHQAHFSEVWWFYQIAETGEGDNDRYVIWNYLENHWSVGQLDRTTGVDSGVFTNPLWIAPDGKIYEHEVGMTADGVPRTVFAISGPARKADSLVQITQVIPDEGAGEYQLSFITWLTPNDSTPRGFGPYSVRVDGYTDVRAHGRDVTIVVESDGLQIFHFGQQRFEVYPDGDR